MPGGLDPAYQAPATNQAVYAVAVQPADGKTVLAGDMNSVNDQSAGTVVRLLTNGELDPAFDNINAGTTSGGDPILAFVVAVDTSGIYVGGSNFNSGEGVVQRLKADGTIDTAFSAVVVDGSVTALAIDSSHNVMIGGSFSHVNGASVVAGVVRVDNSGNLDATFNSPIDDDSEEPIFTGVNTIIPLSTGSFIVTGSFYINSSNVSGGVIRLTSTGAEDGTFMFTPVDNAPVTGAALDANGNIVIVGSDLNKSAGNFTGLAQLGRVKSSGGFDPTFGPDTNALSKTVPAAVVIQSSGRIIVGGSTYPLVAFNSDGSVDRDFLFGTPYSRAQVKALALQPDGNLIAAGTLLLPNYPTGPVPLGAVRVLTNALNASKTVNVTVPGTANPWLAPLFPQDPVDTVPGESPARVTGLALTAGDTLTFSAYGQVNIYGNGQPAYSPPDGDAGSTATHPAQNGLSGVSTNYNSLVGVFVDDSIADASNANAPAALNFADPTNGVPGGFDYTTLQPALNQVFFIGDGMTSGGVAQKVTVPPGAVHLVLGTTDTDTYSDNTGSFTVGVTNAGGGGGGTGPSGAVLTVNSDDLSYTIKNQPNAYVVVPGDVINYSLTVRNTGSAPAANVVVKASFDPANTKLKTVSGNGTATGSLITWTLPSLENGTHEIFTFSVKVKGTVDTQNGIHTGAGLNGVTADAPTVALDADTLPDLQLLVVPPFYINVFNNGGSTAPGGQLIYTFTVVNRTAGAVTNVGAYIPLPANYVPADFNSAQLLDGSGNPIPGATFKLGAPLNGGIDPGAVFVTIPSIGAGQLQQFTFTINVPFDAKPLSDITLPIVQLTGYASDGTKLTFAQANYIAQLSSLPALPAPQVTLVKTIPTTTELTVLQYYANKKQTKPNKDPKITAAQQVFQAIEAYTGTQVVDLLVMPPDQIAALLNPFITPDADPTDASALFDLPSPNTKNPLTFATYMLVYFNSGAGTSAGVTIEDRVPSQLQLWSSSLVVKGVPLTSANGVVGSDGHSLTFSVGTLKPGTGGVIFYRALVPTPTNNGPALGATLPPLTASMETASLSSQIFSTPLESLLITGKADSRIDSSEFDPGDGTAVYNIVYQNTGGQTSKDFVIVSQVPAGGVYQSAHFLNFQQQIDDTQGLQIHNPVDEDTDGKVIFEVGKVRANALGFVQVTYKLADLTPQTKATPGLVHHYYVDGASFPGAPTVNARPGDRVTNLGPQPRFSFGDLLGSFKQGLDNIGHAIGSFFHPGATAAPTVWISRVAPLAVQADTDFSYFITVGNCGSITAYITTLNVDVPTGATFVSSDEGTYYANGNIVIASPHSSDGLQPGKSDTITVTFHCTAPAGSTVSSRSANFSAFADNSFDYGTGSNDCGPVSSYVYSVDQLGSFSALSGTIVSNACLGAGVDPFPLTAGTSYSAHSGNVTPNSTQTAIAHADYLSLTNGATIVAQGGGNIVAQGGGNIVAQGGGNIVAQGGGNIVAQGGGNIMINDVVGFSGSVNVSDLLSAQGLAAIVAQGGGNIVAQGGGNIVAQGGGNILNFENGNSLIATDALSFDVQDVAGFGNSMTLGLISQGGTGLVSQNGDGLISQDGMGFYSQAGGGIFAVGGAGLANPSASSAAAHKPGGSVPRAGLLPPGSVLGSPTSSYHVDFNDAGGLVIGVGGSRLGQ